ncbi:MAG: Zn finger-containing GTPase- Activating Protein for ARF [Pycnora praestabilis]|nr:MAG: Zn finger-containing GTPase- Activating Protein for ARF [Pycnora praestabilis]
MDAFKIPEIARMDKGGNANWRAFFENHEITKSEGKDWDGTSIKDRYDSEVGEEWKARLTAKVEGKEYVQAERRAASRRGGRSETSVGRNRKSEAAAPSPLRSSSPALSLGANSKKSQNEAYFARMGNENASRPADLPPSQGGKFAGFGSEPAPSSSAGTDANGVALPGVDDFQKDPVKALTKGFGWFTTTVGKGVKGVNDGWIQPTAQKLAEADIATQARLTATQLGKNIQSGTKYTADSFNKFVDPNDSTTITHASSSTMPSSRPQGAVVDDGKREFWDNFGAPSSGVMSGGKPSAIGTAAMRKGGGSGTGGGAQGKEDGWEDDKWEKF